MKKDNLAKNNDGILIELIQKQKKNIMSDKKLLYNDLKRISKYLTTSIFNDECSLWNGYITKIKSDDKNSYINFYFNGKKYALHRLLYINYIDELHDSEYIKFKCHNKGKCCNINHIYKVIKNDDEKIIQTNKNISPSIIIPEIKKDIINTQITVDFTL
jgi:hypothetical protein